MSKVIVACGKPGCGKTTYAKRLCTERSAVLLSADEVMLTLFGGDAGLAAKPGRLFELPEQAEADVRINQTV